MFFLIHFFKNLLGYFLNTVCCSFDLQYNCIFYKLTNIYRLLKNTGPSIATCGTPLIIPNPLLKKFLFSPWNFVKSIYIIYCVVIIYLLCPFMSWTLRDCGKNAVLCGNFNLFIGHEYFYYSYIQSYILIDTFFCIFLCLNDSRTE